MMKRLGLILIVLLLAATAHAQTGTIIGRVIDKETNEPLIGGSVRVVGTRLGGTVNLNGNFTIFRVPVGVYTLKVNYTGYNDKSASNISIETDSTITVNFGLTVNPNPDTTLSEPCLSGPPLIDKRNTTSGRIFNEPHYFYFINR